MRVEITIISHSFTLIPAVHNENGNNEKSEDDNDITIEEEKDENLKLREKIDYLNLSGICELCDHDYCVANM